MLAAETVGSARRSSRIRSATSRRASSSRYPAALPVGPVSGGPSTPTLIAGVRSVQAININDLALALRPVFVPGDLLNVRLVKPGEEPGQGVGYLEDGTMVVVEQGRDQIGRTVHVSVTSTLQTTAGRLVFARPEMSRG